MGLLTRTTGSSYTEQEIVAGSERVTVTNGSGAGEGSIVIDVPETEPTTDLRVAYGTEDNWPQANAPLSIAIGNHARTDQTNSVAIGELAQIVYEGPRAQGDSTNCIGRFSSLLVRDATTVDGFALGGVLNVGANQLEVQAYGEHNQAYLGRHCTFGYHNNVNVVAYTQHVAAWENVVIGTYNTMNINSYAEGSYGPNSNYNIIIGTQNQMIVDGVDGYSHSILIGRYGTIEHKNATAIGLGVSTLDHNSFVVGKNGAAASESAVGDFTFEVKDAGKATVTGANAMFVFPPYSVAALPTGVNGGAIFVTDATPAPALCFYNGTDWIDVTTGVAVV